MLSRAGAELDAHVGGWLEVADESTGASWMLVGQLEAVAPWRILVEPAPRLLSNAKKPSPGAHAVRAIVMHRHPA